jgi:hypothetical protein
MLLVNEKAPDAVLSYPTEFICIATKPMAVLLPSGFNV